MINDYLDNLALEVKLISMFDSMPDTQKTDKWLSAFKALCPANIAARLFPVKAWLSGNTHSFTK